MQNSEKLKKENEQVTHVRIDGLRISLELPPFFIFQDMKKGLAYYETYVKEAIEADKIVRTPKSYLEKIIKEIKDEKITTEKVVATFGYEWGYAWAIFTHYREMKFFVRITDKNQESKIEPLVGITEVITKSLLKGESLMIESIEFKDDL